PLAAFGFTPDSRGVAVNQLDGSIGLYELATGKEVKHFAAESRFAEIAVDPKSRQLSACRLSAGAAVQVFDLETGNLALTLPHPKGVRTLAWHPDGKLLAAACDDYRIYVWDLTAPQKPITVLAGHQAEPTSITFNHRGNLLASMSWDGTVRLWDPIAGKELVTSPGALGDGFPA